MNVDKHNHMKEKGMLVILISLITLFIYLLNNDEYIDDFYKKIKDNRVEAALSQNEEIKQPDYNNFEFINKSNFLNIKQVWLVNGFCIMIHLKNQMRFQKISKV